MGRRRNTAKTGDKALYKKRDDLGSNQRRESDDDPVYDAVDRFHKDEEFIQLSREEQGDDSHDEIDRTEAVMDLGLAGESSSSEEEDDDKSDSEEENVHVPGQDRSLGLGDDLDDEEASLSSDDSDQEMPLKTNVRDWGRQKKDYYHGDTADLELGQEEDDAFVEEQAGKEIQAARYQQMTEDDFALSDDEEDHDDDDGRKSEESGLAKPARELSKLSRSEKAKLLDRQHPELLPLVSHFSQILRDWNEETNVVTSALFEGEDGTSESVGATKLGQLYLINKAMLQSSAGLNLAVYLLLKSEQASSENDVDASWVQSHPVMKHLHKINVLLHKLEEQVEDKVPGLHEQMDKLVKASALLAHGEVDFDTEGEAEMDEEERNSSSASDSGDDVSVEKHLLTKTVEEQVDRSSEGTSDESEEETDERARARMITNEARFGLRANEVSTAANSRRRTKKALVSDFGDTEGATDEPELGKSLAATLNSIEQRAAVRQRKISPTADVIDNEDEDDRMQRGLAMMEEDLGPASDRDNESDEDNEGVFDPEQEDDDFYAQVSQKSKRKKDFKKNLYAVQPKYPRMEEEVEGERAISRAILKNRGLVPHKNKLNRNPRVKKREQYRKALIRRKGAVREVRKDEGHKYGGEATGIKTNISRSRRFAS